MVLHEAAGGLIMPEPCDLIVNGGTILDLASPGAVLTGHSIVIVGQMIVAVDGVWRPKRRIDATGMIVSPGFVDAHVHLSAYLGAGRPYVPAAEPGLFSGACRIVEIGEMMVRLMAIPVPDEIAAAVVRPALVAMVRCGITSVVDAGSSAHAGLTAAATDVGIRAAIGPSLADTALAADGSLNLTGDTVALLAHASEFVDAHDNAGDGLVRAMVSAADSISCSDELLAGIATLAAETGTPTHVHSHISTASNRAHLDAYGRNETRRLADAGMLSDRCTLMHVGVIDDADLDAFVHAGITVNHNPLGNAMLGFGSAPGRSLRRLLDAGVPVVMGSDYSPSMTATPFDMMHAALTVHREIAAADNALTLEEVLAISTNPSVSLGRPGGLGRIAPGQLADLVLVDLTGPHHLGTTHPVPNLALRARPADVHTVVINGRVVLDDRQLVTTDEAAILAEAAEAFKNLAGPPPG